MTACVCWAVSCGAPRRCWARLSISASEPFRRIPAVLATSSRGCIAWADARATKQPTPRRVAYGQLITVARKTRRQAPKVATALLRGTEPAVRHLADAIETIPAASRSGAGPERAAGSPRRGGAGGRQDPQPVRAAHSDHRSPQGRPTCRIRAQGVAGGGRERHHQRLALARHVRSGHPLPDAEPGVAPAAVRQASSAGGRWPRSFLAEHISFGEASQEQRRRCHLTVRSGARRAQPDKQVTNAAALSRAMTVRPNLCRIFAVQV